MQLHLRLQGGSSLRLNLKAIFIKSGLIHLKNIQQIAQSIEFQNMNRILKLQDQIRQQSQFVEQIKVNATPDLHHCITTAYFEKSQLLVSIFQENIFPIIMILKLKK